MKARERIAELELRLQASEEAYRITDCQKRALAGLVESLQGTISLLEEQLAGLRASLAQAEDLLFPKPEDPEEDFLRRIEERERGLDAILDARERGE